MIEDILFALWFFLPAGMANMVPIPVSKIPAFKKYDAPLDMGKTWRGKRIFGSHKTWRGLVAGIIAATLTLWAQKYLVVQFDWFDSFAKQVDYQSLPVLIMGPLFALGALGGDAIESFFKRQFNRAPGEGWFPFDQTDYIIGGAIATLPFVSLTLWQYLWLIIVWLIVHVISTVIGYLIGLKDKPI